jgi:hypothetical protein
MSYLEAGQDNGGPIVVLIHGLAGDGAHWRDVIAGLGRHTHILAPDLLGHGESDAPHNADYTVSAHASRLRDLLRCLGHQQASLVGHSFGGGVAISCCPAAASNWSTPGTSPTSNTRTRSPRSSSICSATPNASWTAPRPDFQGCRAELDDGLRPAVSEQH